MRKCLHLLLPSGGLWARGLPALLSACPMRIHRSTTEKYSERFFNYLIWWVRLRVRVLVVVRVWVRVTVDARVMVGVGLVRG